MNTMDLYSIIKRLPLSAALELASQEKTVSTVPPPRRDSMLPTARPGQ